MRHFNQGRFRQQARFLQHQFLQDGNLPFSDILSTESIEKTLTALQVGWVDRIYTPLVTLCAFLGQVLSADHSCRAAVARLIASRGKNARAARKLARTVRPQPPQQKPGLGFPLMRIAVIFSLACGAVLDVGMCRYAGKGQSELALLRQMWSIFKPGSILLADRLMCAWTELVMLKQRDVDSVCRFTSHRKADFRRGQRLGKDDHIVTWHKPTKPRSIDRETYDALPDSLTIRSAVPSV